MSAKKESLVLHAPDFKNIFNFIFFFHNIKLILVQYIKDKMKQEHIVIGVILVIIVIAIYLMAKNREGFASQTADELETQILSKYKTDVSGKSADELKDLVARMRLRLDKFGLYPDGSAPDLSRYALKSEVVPGAGGRCLVSNAEDRDKYISKSDLPDPAPKVDLSKYVLKSSIPPEKICPPQREIDYSKYVLKSSLPPPQKCPPCICPKVKVSAGLCQKCPPPPKCPPPQPCDQAKCPEVQPCPAAPLCPAPKACPHEQAKTFYDVKYIKVPTVITKTITVDSYGNVLKQNIQTEAGAMDPSATHAPGATSGPGASESSSSTMATSITSAPTQMAVGQTNYATVSNPLAESSTSSSSTARSSGSAGSAGSMGSAGTSSYTVAPAGSPNNLTNFASNMATPVTTMNPTQNTQYMYFNPELNSEFKKTGIYGYPSPY